MLPSLLLVCAVITSARCGPSASVTGSEGVTLEQLAAELVRVVETSVSSATAGSLQRITEVLGGIQQSLTAVSTRLDELGDSQRRLEEAHGELVSQLQSLQESNVQILDRLDRQRDSHRTSPGTPPRVLPAGEDAVSVLYEASSGAAVSGADRQSAGTSGQNDTTERPTTTTTTATTTITTEPPASHIVLGQRCEYDSDCTPYQPQTECGGRGECSCRSDYRQVSDTECRRRSGLSQPCTEDADCKIPDSVCTGGVCNCGSRFWNHANEKCRRMSRMTEGGSCLGDPDCRVEYGLQCTSGACKCKASVHGQYEYRVAGGTSCSSGRVELRLAGGAWGFVCDDSWGNIDAGVFCRSLLGFNFTSGQASSRAKYGGGTNFYMDDVDCDGSEPHLLRCSYNGWGTHNCGAREASSVACRE